jgi:hypothetical protein
MNFAGYYLINPKHQATGANRVDFKLRFDSGPQVRVNNSGWRNITDAELKTLREKYMRDGEIWSVYI